MKGIFGQIEKLITEHGSAEILRERLKLAEDQFKVLEQQKYESEQENHALRQQVAQLKEENRQLQQTVGGQADKTSDFDEDTHKMLKVFFGSPHGAFLEDVARSIGLDMGMAAYHRDQLSKAGFIFVSGLHQFTITPEGRKYVVRNKLHQ